MDKKTILASLNKVANSLENSGLFKEADDITNVMQKIAQMIGPAKGDTSRDLNWKWIQTTPQAKAALAYPQPMAALLSLLEAQKQEIPAMYNQAAIAHHLNEWKKDPNYIPGA